MTTITEIGGRRMPFLRWSFLRTAWGRRGLPHTWQVGDGREEALRDVILQQARPGDLDDAIRVADEFCYTRTFMSNVGDEKGAILEDAVAKAAPGWCSSWARTAATAACGSLARCLRAPASCPST